MRAIRLREPGGPEKLEWADAPDPWPAPVRSSSRSRPSAVNRADLLQRQGHYPPPPGASEILGLECSGTIVEVGDGVEGWRVGDEVCALLAGGGYAQRVAVPAAQLLPVPDGMELTTAGLAAGGGLHGVVQRRHARTPHHGETLLVHGGAGGIGTHAIQVGKALGATVAVTAGLRERAKRCRQLGADIAIDYRKQDFVERDQEKPTGGADVILDNMGAKYLGR